MNPDDKSLFLDAMEDVQSLKRCADIHWQPSRNTRTRQALNTEQLDNFLTLGFLELLPLAEPLAFQREGVQQGLLISSVPVNIPARPASILYASLLNSAVRCCFRLSVRPNVTGCATW
jgi:hypothetical protein